RIPMGATGKADLTGLMPGARPDAETPAGTTTAAVRKIWCDVLEIAGVEDDDDFFTLGGNSVKATSAIVEVRGGLAAGLPIRTLFEQPVFTDFCRAVSAYKASTENDK
ncbi:MAG TPA: phosphopantetheine-binding protein, partial [Streptosporangiaceae bacterium]|nr:phosphopantetheine-binding protein [Streptosporangiaceae bacterium]